MWYIGDESDESSNREIIDHTNTSDKSIAVPHQNSENDWAENNLPLPCPCSEATLGSLASYSRSSLQKLIHSPSSTVSLLRLKNECRPISREIARGGILGSTISFILIATMLFLMPDSTVRWMQTFKRELVNGRYLWGHLDTSGHSSSHLGKRGSRRVKEVFYQKSGPLIHHRNGTIRAMSPLAADKTTKSSVSNSNRHRSLQDSEGYSYGDLYDTNEYSTGTLYDPSGEEDGPPPPIPEETGDPDELVPKDPQLVIAGKMTVEHGACNVAQLNLKTGKWSLRQRIQLSLYNSYSGGEVYSLLANHTLVTNSNAKEFSAGGSSAKHVDLPHVMDKTFGGNLIVVGAFDTTYRNSQTTYCSVGKWDGSELSKIGEGLCNSALSKGMKITSAAIAGPNDLYVGGSFQTQVWNGKKHEFVKIFNIAHYNAIDQVWLPLPVGQITCSWCTVTILALAWDSQRRQLHVAGKFNAIDGSNIPAGLAVYDQDSGHLVAHPGGGLTMKNVTQDGVGTAVQFDQENGVLYVMGAFEKLTATNEDCLGLAAFEIKTGSWTCLADPAHSVLPTGGGNMLLTPYGLLVAGKTTNGTTWPDSSRPYTVAVLKATIKKKVFIIETTTSGKSDDDDYYRVEPSEKASKSRQLMNETNVGEDSDSHNSSDEATNMPTMKAEADHEFIWSWLPGFHGHDEPIHTLSNGFGDYVGTVFIGGDNFVSKWSYKTVEVKCNTTDTKATRDTKTTRGRTSSSSSCTQKTFVPVTVDLANDHVQGAIMAISQLDPQLDNSKEKASTRQSVIGYTIIVYCVTLGALVGMFIALMCNKSINQTIMSFLFDRDAAMKGISLDTLTYSHVQNTNVAEAYHRAMSNRFVKHPHLLTLIDPQEVILHRIIGEGTFGRVWSAKWGSSGVAVKEFVFAQAAVAGKSRQQQAIVEEIIGEAGMMAILRHPNVLQLFGCSLTAQAIWIVSELCSLGSLRQLLDDRERTLPLPARLDLALQVAEGMAYLHAQDPPIIHRDLKSHNIFVHETFAPLEPKEKSNDSRLLRWPKVKKSDSHNPKVKKSDSQNMKKSDSNSVSDSASGSGGLRKLKIENSSKSKITSSMSAKIGDWGSARATLAGSRTMTHGVGTACWMAPEVLKHARSSRYSDVYGFGIVLWELATRREVYEGLESTQIIAMVANDHLRPEVPPGCPWNDVMVKCWREVPSERPTFEEIVKELNRLGPSVKVSKYTGEDLQAPKWKVNSYQKGGLPTLPTQVDRKTG